MMKTIIFLAATVCLGGTAKADAIMRPGDFYLISRDSGGSFVGSHKLFQDQSRGLRLVSYCQRDYFVRSHSVAWTQIETELGHTVRVEYNFGRGWRPICDHPEQQVTLKDIGIDISARDLLAGPDDSQNPQSRLSAVGSLFQAQNGNGSFLTR
ncbi:hypothetical protein [Roseibium sp. Sym1]|uniref:hypothetical protein n=1 Tax=Roseibium sp. Sym1 TaxID=3016006 RepID=UPI0022B49E72|nr:hypothetical protein [Roseibium sp. Sym1]